MLNQVPLINGPKEGQGRTIPLDFIRHGSTEMNDHDGDGDKIRGWIDVPLDARGKEESKTLGKRLCKANPRPDLVVSSDLRRSMETAHIISQICGIPFLGPVEALRPWNLAGLQGQESAKVAPIIQRLTHNPDQQAPGGGESFHWFARRFLNGVRSLLMRFQGKRLGIVAHHRNERLLSAIDRAGWPMDGSIDQKEFVHHGDAPGFMVTFEIPVSWLFPATQRQMLRQRRM